jgi:hypothetical protein
MSGHSAHDHSCAFLRCERSQPEVVKVDSRRFFSVGIGLEEETPQAVERLATERECNRSPTIRLLIKQAVAGDRAQDVQRQESEAKCG